MTKTNRSPKSKVFDLLSDGNEFVAQTKESLMGMRARKKIPTTLMSMSDIRRSFVPIPNFYVQGTFNTYGLQPGTVFEIIGPEGIGKTTLAFTIGGWAMSSGYPFYYLHTEGKLMDANRISRCLHTDKATAQRMLNVMSIDEAYEIRHAVTNIEQWVDAVRNVNDITVPMDIPLVVVIDTWSKLMSPGEAMGVYDIIGEFDNKSKVKDLGTASNLEHSKITHYWCRRLPYWLKQNNVLLIVVSHQNQKVDMGFGGGSFMSADVAAGFNKTKIGGNALNQNTATQVILRRMGMAKNGSGDNIGTKVQMRVVKNSFGAEHNLCNYEVRTRPASDTDTYQEPALDFNEGMANWFAENKYLGTTVSRKRYSTTELGVTSVTAAEFCETFHAREDLKEKLGSQLGLIGYDTGTTLQEVPDPEKIAEVTEDKETKTTKK